MLQACAIPDHKLDHLFRETWHSQRYLPKPHLHKTWFVFGCKAYAISTSSQEHLSTFLGQSLVPSFLAAVITTGLSMIVFIICVVTADASSYHAHKPKSLSLTPLAQAKVQAAVKLTCDGTCTILLGPGCHATMAICFWIVCKSGGSSGFVRYENDTTPSASSFSCFVQSCSCSQCVSHEVLCCDYSVHSSNMSRHYQCSIVSSLSLTVARVVWCL